eukprot:5668231-Pleurochrysis_carterae.AAC.1
MAGGGYCSTPPMQMQMHQQSGGQPVQNAGAPGAAPNMRGAQGTMPCGMPGGMQGAPGCAAMPCAGMRGCGAVCGGSPGPTAQMHSCASGAMLSKSGPMPPRQPPPMFNQMS